MLQTAICPPEAELEKVIRLAISDIQALKQEATLHFALHAGEVVVRRFFGGDLKKMRRRGPKDVAICRLAEHPELPISAASLYVAVQVYELVDRLGGPDANGVLQLSHYRAVLTAPHDVQKQLLDQAADNAWTVARLRQEAGGSLPPRDRAEGGTPRRTMISRRLQAVVQEATKINDLDPVEVATTCSPEELKKAATASQDIGHFFDECMAVVTKCLDKDGTLSTATEEHTVEVPIDPRHALMSGGGVHLLR